jgi:RNA polymerase sigma-70 factor (ECF subfamily)
MGDAGDTDITRILKEASRGGDSAVRRLMPIVYGELRALAQSYLRQERPDHTLQATALVHEAYVRLIRQEEVEWQSRAHFFGVAAQAIRRILVDHAREHQRCKRGGDRRRVQLDEDTPALQSGNPDLLILDEAMHRLAEFHERAARVVELRFFGGLSRQETAEFLGVSLRTVADDWRLARAWLRREIEEDETS